MMRNARSARLVDGADEVHQQTIARNVIAAYKETGSTRSETTVIRACVARQRVP